jgi:signal peptidase I
VRWKAASIAREDGTHATAAQARTIADAGRNFPAAAFSYPARPGHWGMPMQHTIRTLLRDNRGFIVFVALMVVFRSSLADWNSVPTGSMNPTIVEGDRILVNKLAYDISFPLTHTRLVHLAEPQRGDVVTFESAAAKTRLVKRVIGLPGETVQLIDNHLIVNGVEAAYSDVTASPRGFEATENLLGMTHKIRVSNGQGPLANYGPVTVPAGHFLMLGDNRDNSSDSRVIGPVPREEISGRSQRVVMSLNYDNYYIPRSDRFLHRLE